MCNNYEEDEDEMLYSSVDFLTKTIHRDNAKWWIDLETGEDVRKWPKKHLNTWIGTKLMLCVSELAEAMEGLRKDQMDDKLPHRKMLEVELSDCIIRVLDLAGGLNLDVAGALVEKLAFNRNREDFKLNNRKKAGGKSI
jgi:NTP pyrophosphatase (non-canonical NTP hydrolase)